jgi:hypothetical protein
MVMRWNHFGGWYAMESFSMVLFSVVFVDYAVVFSFSGIAR